MKSSDRAILIGLVVVGLFGAFWFLALSPKRDKASELDASISSLQSEVTAQQALVSQGQQAEADYERNYSALVVLGKAAPADGDTPSLLEQLIAINQKAHTSFTRLALGTAPDELPAAAAAATTPAAGAPAPAGEAAPAGETASTPVAATSATPTEADASTLPIGATVGSADLSVLPYDMEFSGSFFQIADLFQGIDSLISSKLANVDVGGRLVTVNGFKMTKEDALSPLKVELSLATYVLPESQGLTAGGTSTMPPAAVPAGTPTTVSTTP